MKPHIRRQDTVAVRMAGSPSIWMFADRHAGDRPENLLYRLQDGEWQRDMHPKYVVIMIGINTIRRYHQDDDSSETAVEPLVRCAVKHHNHPHESAVVFLQRHSRSYTRCLLLH